jgi:RHS repeat-associated protein
MSLAPPFAPSRVFESAGEDAATRTRYRGLGRDAAVALAKRVFDVEHPGWSPPEADGGRIERYYGNNAALQRLPNGSHVVVSSSVPLRVDGGDGLVPTSLALRDEGGVFVPEHPVAPVEIASRPEGGITFVQGIQMVPVGAESGAEAPMITGNRAIFANAERDTDLIEEPRPSGAAMSWQIRSAESPQEMGVTFSLPGGGELRPSASSPGCVEVVVEGKPVLMVHPVSAQDADGNPVPASFSIDGDTLTTHVDLSGEVAFPVFVDPEVSEFYGHYGTYDGAHMWNGWTEKASTGGYGAEKNETWYKIGANPGVPVNSYGELRIGVPGPQGKSGSAGITRVDLSGVQHGTGTESRLVAQIGGSNGSLPVYTFNGTTGPVERSPLSEKGTFSGQTIAFCAQEGGGLDGQNPGLCDEELNQGTEFNLWVEMLTAQANFNWVLMEGAQVDYRDPAPPNRVVLNHPGYENQWLKTAPSNWTIEAEDEGLGISELQVEIPAGGATFASESENCTSEHGVSGAGFTGCPSSVKSPPLNLSGVHETGDLRVASVAIDAAAHGTILNGGAAGSPTSLFLDQEKPSISAFGGTLGKAENGIIGDGQYTLEFGATDGSASSPQSGVRTLEVKVDGRLQSSVTSKCPEPRGVPGEGCFGLNGKWTVSGQSLGAGSHLVTVIAKDWVGNEATKSFVVTINEAAYEPLGPGAANLETGDYKLNPTDVSIAAGAASLSVSRTYDSRSLTQGASGPLGPQWSLSLPNTAAGGDWQSMSQLEGGSVDAYDAHGNQLVFKKEGSSWVSPPGYQNDTLTEPSTSPAEYQVTDSEGNYTRFAQPAAGALFVPTTSAQSASAGGLNKVQYSFTKTSEGITEPTRVLGPEPSEGACTSTLVKGCRALTFTYATTTTAVGEAQSEWGEYKGRLVKVSFTGWDPSKSEMTTTAVAQYAYDKQGRVRAAWDPRISPALKTTYGYDSEGHVTAVGPPGQQPWLIHYGTIASDAAAGRTLGVARPNAETVLWNGQSLTNTTAPSLSTSSPVAGSSLSVNNGSWSSAAVTYAYQWERCNRAGAECVAIAGATNQTYTPVLADILHALAAQVTATNASGSATSTTTTSTPVKTGALAFQSHFGSSGTGAGQLAGPEAMALASNGYVWVADSGNHRIDMFSPSGEFVETIGWGVSNGKEQLETCTSGFSCQAGLSGSGAGQFADAEGIAINQSTGNIYVADSANDRIEEFNSSGEYARIFGGYGNEHGKLSYPHGVAVDESGNVWVVDTGNCRVQEFSATGAYMASWGECGTGAGKFKDPADVAIAEGNIYVTNVESGKIQEFKPNGTLAHEFGEAGTGKGQLTNPWGITFDPLNAELYVTSEWEGRVAAFTPEGGFIEEFGHFGSGPGELEGPVSVAANPSNGTVYVDEEWDPRIDIWTPPSIPTTEPTQPAPNPGTTAVNTIDYEVPLSGAGLPTMTKEEVAKWEQTDIPAEATAIFPPDEPQGWPASDYNRASIYYLDSANRTVNTTSPSGGIATAEYEAKSDDLTRTLTATNRLKALKPEGAADALTLGTNYSYSADGTELTEKRGPVRRIRLPNGSESEWRPQTKYYYDEGAPSGGPYRLVTKTTEGTMPWIKGGESAELRTVTKSYSGQENLGWKLHEPTSTTVTVKGHSLVSKTAYNPSTGQATESKAPAGTAGEAAAPAYSGQIGSGHLKEPREVAVDSKGNIWVADSADNQVEEFTETGTVVRTITGTGTGALKEPKGVAVDNKGDVWVADTANNRLEEFSEAGKLERTVGSSGTEGGKFNTPRGITIDAEGNLWVVDYGNNRVEKFSSVGKYEKTIGTGGLNDPSGEAVVDHNGHLWVADTGNDRLVEFNTTNGESIKTVGTGGSGPTEFNQPKAIAVDAHNNLWVVDAENGRVQELTETGEYLTQFGKKGTGAEQFSAAWGLAIDQHGNLLVSDTNQNWITKWAPAPGTYRAHDTQTIYYSSAANPTYPSCGAHAEWANLPCQGQPAEQPGTTGLPNLPVTTYAYNLWDEPTTTTDTIGASTRKATITYDNAGRLKTSAIEATTGSPLPTVTDEYNTETGALTKQSTPERTVSSVYNTLGQLTSYTDADGGVTKYEYEKERDSRLAKTIEAEGTPAAGNQTYNYNTTTGELETVTDSAAGAFTAARDIEGRIVSEAYPNGLVAKYTYNEAGERIGLEDVKTTHCSSGCTWYTDSVIPSIHGQWREQTSSLSKQVYEYDELGRLTEVKETPAGQGCTTRLYTFDEDSNRTSLTTREPGAEGHCATTGGTSQSYTYDSADRLNEAGVTYDSFGNTTTLPAADAGGQALTSTYYTNNKIASQEQNGQKISYKLDPLGRTRETVAGTTTTTLHYQGPGAAPAWSTSTGGAWTRDIGGVGGALAAVQTTGATPVLQLVDLHGDVIATTEDSETETKPTANSETTEYGVPRTTVAKQYTWLGASQAPTELPTGAINMGARAYIPQLGRFEQTDPEPGGSMNSYAYTTADPINEADLSGEWTYNLENAHAGSGGQGPEHFFAPGAIIPPPADLQAEQELASRMTSSSASAYGYGGFWTNPIEGGGGRNAMAAAPCAHGDTASANHCSAQGYPVGACEVRFAGRVSSCSQVLARARVEYQRDNANYSAVKQGISEIIKGAKESTVKLEEYGATLEEDMVAVE